MTPDETVLPSDLTDLIKKVHKHFTKPLLISLPLDYFSPGHQWFIEHRAGMIWTNMQRESDKNSGREKRLERDKKNMSAQYLETYKSSHFKGGKKIP